MAPKKAKIAQWTNEQIQKLLTEEVQGFQDKNNEEEKDNFVDELEPRVRALFDDGELIPEDLDVVGFLNTYYNE